MPNLTAKTDRTPESAEEIREGKKENSVPTEE